MTFVLFTGTATVWIIRAIPSNVRCSISSFLQRNFNLQPRFGSNCKKNAYDPKLSASKNASLIPILISNGTSKETEQKINREGIDTQNGTYAQINLVAHAPGRINTNLSTIEMHSINASKNNEELEDNVKSISLAKLGNDTKSQSFFEIQKTGSSSSSSSSSGSSSSWSSSSSLQSSHSSSSSQSSHSANSLSSNNNHNEKNSLSGQQSSQNIGSSGHGGTDKSTTGEDYGDYDLKEGAGKHTSNSKHETPQTSGQKESQRQSTSSGGTNSQSFGTNQGNANSQHGASSSHNSGSHSSGSGDGLNVDVGGSDALININMGGMNNHNHNGEHSGSSQGSSSSQHSSVSPHSGSLSNESKDSLLNLGLGDSNSLLHVGLGGKDNHENGANSESRSTQGGSQNVHGSNQTQQNIGGNNQWSVSWSSQWGNSSGQQNGQGQNGSTANGESMSQSSNLTDESNLNENSSSLASNKNQSQNNKEFSQNGNLNINNTNSHNNQSSSSSSSSNSLGTVGNANSTESKSKCPFTNGASSSQNSNSVVPQSNILWSFECSYRGQTFRDPSNCAKFYYCGVKGVNHLQCPSPLLFDVVLKKCNWPEQVNCSQSSSNGQFSFTITKSGSQGSGLQTGQNSNQNSGSNHENSSGQQSSHNTGSSSPGEGLLNAGVGGPNGLSVSLGRPIGLINSVLGSGSNLTPNRQLLNLILGQLNGQQSSSSLGSNQANQNSGLNLGSNGGNEQSNGGLLNLILGGLDSSRGSSDHNNQNSGNSDINQGNHNSGSSGNGDNAYTIF